MIYDDELGQDMAYMPPQDVTIEHGMKQGLHDAVKDLIRLAFVGGTIIIIAGAFLGEKTVKKVLGKIS